MRAAVFTFGSSARMELWFFKRSKTSYWQITTRIFISGIECYSQYIEHVVLGRPASTYTGNLLTL